MVLLASRLLAQRRATAGQLLDPDVEVIGLKNADDIAQLLPAQRDNVAYIGPVPSRATQLGIRSEGSIPGVIDFLHYHRSIKTDYELACMREAQKLAVGPSRSERGVLLRHERV